MGHMRKPTADRESRLRHAISALRGLPRRTTPDPPPAPDEPPAPDDSPAPPTPEPFSDDRLEALRADARYHRERYELYRARSYGMRPTSASRMRELERAQAQAEERLAQAEARSR